MGPVLNPITAEILSNCQISLSEHILCSVLPNDLFLVLVLVLFGHLRITITQHPPFDPVLTDVAITVSV